MCVFIRGNGKRLVSLVLVPIVAINTYVGGRMIIKHFSKTSEPELLNSAVTMSLEESYRAVESCSAPIQSKSSEEVSEIKDSNVGNVVADNLVYMEQETIFGDSNEGNLFERLHHKYESSGKTVDDIIGEGVRSDELYASALYEKLKLAQISDEEIKKELNNILRLSLTFTDFSMEMWEELFGNMLGTIDECENVMDYYYPLAIYVHKSECDLEHRSHEFDETRLTCDNLEEMNRKSMEEMSFSHYVVEMVEASDDEALKKNMRRLMQSGVNIDAAIVELDMVYFLSQLPTCLDEETWNLVFSTLLQTVSEEENVCEVYGNLATFVHLLYCDFEHSLNDFGVLSCEGLKLIYTNSMNE